MQTNEPPQTIADCQKRIEPYLNVIVPDDLKDIDWSEYKAWAKWSGCRAWYEKVSALPAEQQDELRHRFRIILGLGLALICQGGTSAGLLSYRDVEDHWPVSEATLREAFDENLRSVQYDQPLPPFTLVAKLFPYQQ